MGIKIDIRGITRPKKIPTHKAVVERPNDKLLFDTEKIINLIITLAIAATVIPAITPGIL